jgi:hypothetical protein
MIKVLIPAAKVSKFTALSNNQRVQEFEIADRSRLLTINLKEGRLLLTSLTKLATITPALVNGPDKKLSEERG